MNKVLKRHKLPKLTKEKINRAWKKPRCPLTDEWIRKLWYIYIMEYSSAIERDWWMNLEPIIQSDVSQKEKHQYNILMHIYGI